MNSYYDDQQEREVLQVRVEGEHEVYQTVMKWITDNCNDITETEMKSLKIACKASVLIVQFWQDYKDGTLPDPEIVSEYSYLVKSIY